jgi:hypothetical protein
MNTRPRSFGQECLGFLLHLPAGTIGGAFSAIFSAALVFVVQRIFGWVGILGSIYDPLLWLPAATLGFFINRVADHRSAVIVGPLVGACFCALMYWDIASLHRVPYYTNLIQENYQGSFWTYEFQKLFPSSNRGCGPDECLGSLLFTFPFLASMAYSFGAWLALRFPKLQNRSTLASNV